MLPYTSWKEGKIDLVDCLLASAERIQCVCVRVCVCVCVNVFV
jgi:hypothetical protein